MSVLVTRLLVLLLLVLAVLLLLVLVLVLFGASGDVGVFVRRRRNDADGDFVVDSYPPTMLIPNSWIFGIGVSSEAEMVFGDLQRFGPT